MDGKKEAFIIVGYAGDCKKVSVGIHLILQFCRCFPDGNCFYRALANFGRMGFMPKSPMLTITSIKQDQVCERIFGKR